MFRTPHLWLLFVITLLTFTLCINVKITDRKPRWAVKTEEPSPNVDTVLPPQQEMEQSISINTKPAETATTPVFDPSTLPRSRPAKPMKGPDVLKSLASTCVVYEERNYDYYICPYQYIMQVEKRTAGYKGCIGIWDDFSESPYQNEEVCMRYTDGDACPGEKRRTTDLIIACDISCASLCIQSVVEEKMCEYVIEATSALVCSIDRNEMIDEAKEYERPIQEEEVNEPSDDENMMEHRKQFLKEIAEDVEFLSDQCLHIQNQLNVVQESGFCSTNTYYFPPTCIRIN